MKTKIAMVLCFVAVCALAQEDERLQQLLKKYPQADADQDGMLTKQEALQYRKKMEGGQGAKKKKTPEARIQPDYADVKYGPHERNVLDLWLAKRADGQPAPLAVFIHGGGFTGGDKNKVSAGSIEKLRDAGISVASINYRLTEGGKHPYPAPMHDGARSIQFLRLNANKYNLDKTRVATFGGSAGGCMSFWLAFHDDLADPANPDPVLRESTRLTCIAPSAGQAALDPEHIYAWFGCTNLVEHGGMRPLFGITELEEMKKPEVQALVKDASPITHLTKDDPPAFMSYGGGNDPVDETTPSGKWVHHPIFGIKCKEAMDKLGIEAWVSYPGGPEVSEYESGVDFMIRKLMQKK
jgi:acetyl esterase/lipase